MSTLKKDFISGIKWTGLSRFGVQSIQSLSTIILAWLLSPKEFGVIGIANIFILFSNTINQLGISSAIVHRSDIDDEHLSSAFWANMVTGTTLCIIMTGISYPAAIFFRNPQIQPVLSALSFVFILAALRIVQNAQFSKKLQFKKLAIIETGEIFSNGVVSIILAFKGFGVWSLVYGRLFGVLSGVVLAWSMSSWRPKMLFNFIKFKQLFKFGSNVMATNIFTYLSNNVDYVIIGRLLGAAPLGLYTMAYNFVTIPERRFSSIFTSVAFPTLSKINTDKKRAADVYLKMLRHISFITFPLLAGLGVIAPRLFNIILSSKWEGAILPLQIMCVAGILKSIGTTVGSVFYSQGRPDLEFKLDIFTLATIIPCLLIGAKYGITGVAAATSIYAFFIKFLYFKIAGSLLEISVMDIIHSLYRTFLITALMVLAIIVLNIFLDHSVLSLITIIASGILVYGALIFFLENKIIIEWRDAVYQRA